MPPVVFVPYVIRNPETDCWVIVPGKLGVVVRDQERGTLVTDAAHRSTYYGNAEMSAEQVPDLLTFIQSLPDRYPA